MRTSKARGFPGHAAAVASAITGITPAITDITRSTDLFPR
jgi:hypothetical protein